MEEYEVRVLCARDSRDAVTKYMKDNGYKRVSRRIMTGTDQRGILEAEDLDSAVLKAERIKLDLGKKVVRLKLIPPQ